MEQRSLYDRLGGGEAVTAVIEDFVARCAADERINMKFARTDIPRLTAKLTCAPDASSPMNWLTSSVSIVLPPSTTARAPSACCCSHATAGGVG